MGITPARESEPVRLVIWDLDDVFWEGTLSEGGITWISRNAEIVAELSRRGIISSICSKNDLVDVEAVLRAHGLRDQFVFLSVDWTAKGPRLARLAAAVQLRPQSVMFIDDNAMNRAEASYYVPGLQVADQTIIPGLLADPRFEGKPDAKLTRLMQYKLLETRQVNLVRSGNDVTTFLRESEITISIDFDVASELDRAIELINRTNQLNFVKARLPEDKAAARHALQQIIAHHTVSAGLVRVRDRYGDYGICGIYICQADRAGSHPRLLQFAFSCRILGMGIETWLYRHLNRPTLKVVGEVATNIFVDGEAIDWVRLELPSLKSEAEEHPRTLSYVLARGGCDMRALVHYFDMVSNRVVEEIAGVRGGVTRLSCSSVVAVHAIKGVSKDFVRDCAPLGFAPEDFVSLIADPPPAENGVWLLNFTLEQPVPVLRHIATGCLIPAWLVGIKGPPLQMLNMRPRESGLAPALVRHLRRNFEMLGLLPDEIFEGNLRLILSQAARALPGRVGIFILLANEEKLSPDGSVTVLKPMRNRNRIIIEAARDFPEVELLSPTAFMSRQEICQLQEPHHYDRIVYFRMFQHVMNRCPPYSEDRLKGSASQCL